MKIIYILEVYFFMYRKFHFFISTHTHAPTTDHGTEERPAHTQKNKHTKLNQLEFEN